MLETTRLVPVMRRMVTRTWTVRRLLNWNTPTEIRLSTRKTTAARLSSPTTASFSLPFTLSAALARRMAAMVLARGV